MMGRVLAVTADDDIELVQAAGQVGQAHDLGKAGGRFLATPVWLAITMAFWVLAAKCVAARSIISPADGT
jgi:hypothetical protein